MAHALTNTHIESNNLGLISRARNAIAQYRSYRRTLNELQALSPRELSDLGLSQVSIRDVAREAAYWR